jgi:5-formyltetrahydrofolate cyclo-ligase
VNDQGDAKAQDGDGAAARKDTVRRCVLAARDDVPSADRARLSAAVCARAEELPELLAARTILLYAPFRSEIDVTPLLAWALGRGTTLCLPRILGRRHMEAFRVRDLDADLEPGSWGIPEPRADLPIVPPAEIDVVAVPGAMFDEEGGRCGYGGGFYDTFLLRTRPGTTRIALGFDLQIVDEVPREPHDLGVDVIVTERRVIRTG